MEFNYIIGIKTTKEKTNNTIKDKDILNKYPFMNYITKIQDDDKKEAIVKEFTDLLNIDLTTENNDYIITLNQQSCVKRLEKTYETFENFSRKINLDKETFPYVRGLAKVLLTNQFGEYVVIDDERIISLDDYMAELIFSGELDNKSQKFYVDNIYKYFF